MGFLHPLLRRCLSLEGWICWFIALFLPALSAAQPYLAREYAIEEGLVQSQVRTIFQDQKGFIWFGTHGGISRFDGMQFQNYTVDDGLVSNKVYDFEEDTRGRLWIATAAGVHVFGEEGIQALGSRFGLPEGAVYDLAWGNSGQLWIASQFGLSLLDGESVQEFTTADGLPEGPVTRLAHDGDETLWIGTANQVCRVDGFRARCYTAEDGFPPGFVWELEVDDRGCVWVVTSTALLVLDPGRGDYFESVDQVRGATTVFADPDGDTWIGTQNSIFRLDPSGTIVGQKTPLTSTPSSIFQDRESNLWIGSSGRGVTQLQPTAFTHANATMGLPDDAYLAAHTDPDGVVWIGSLSNGLYRIEGDAIEHFSHTEEALLRHIRKLSQGPDGNLWIASVGGVGYFDGSAFTTVYTPATNSLPYIYTIAHDHAGALWIGTRNGLFREVDDTIERLDLNTGNAWQTIFSIVPDNDRLWLATHDGLFYWRNERLHRIKAFEGKSVTTLTRDASGMYWIGSQGYGVLQFNPHTEAIVDTLTVADGLNSGMIYFTTHDRHGHLWVGTSHGVNRLDLSTYQHSGEKVIRAYGLHDGIEGLETNMNAATVDHLGRLWFGTIDGLMEYDVGSRRVNEQPPPIYLTGIRLFLDEMHWADALKDPTFTYEDNHITFDFVAPSFTASEQLRYEYRLHGFDVDWSPVTPSRYATYANLPPGHYTFEVTASNSDGIYSDRSAIYAFEVIPPFWKTGWFRAFSLLGIVFVVILIVQWRTSALNKQQRRLEKMVTSRTRDLEETHSELLDTREAALVAAKSKSAFLSNMTHELRTPMNGIVGMTELLRITDMSDEQVEYADTIFECSSYMMDLIENLLSVADLAAGKKVVNIESFYLPDLMAEVLESVRIKADAKSVAMRGFISPNVPHSLRGDREHVRQVLHHLLTNAVKFTYSGLIVLEVDARQRVSEDEESRVRFSIHDTGIGMEQHQLANIFEVFSQVDTSATRSFQGMGLGLALVQQISLLLGGTLTAESWPRIGSSFHFEAPASLENTGTTPHRGPLAGRRIHLSLHDSREYRRLTLLCRSLGMVIQPALRAEVDIVISDANFSVTGVPFIRFSNQSTQPVDGLVVAKETSVDDIERLLRSAILNSDAAYSS